MCLGEYSQKVSLCYPRPRGSPVLQALANPLNTLVGVSFLHPCPPFQDRCAGQPERKLLLARNYDFLRGQLLDPLPFMGHLMIDSSRSQGQTQAERVADFPSQSDRRLALSERRVGITEHPRRHGRKSEGNDARVSAVPKDHSPMFLLIVPGNDKLQVIEGRSELSAVKEDHAQ